jgi:hypothetical protein
VREIAAALGVGMEELVAAVEREAGKRPNAPPAGARRAARR